jgi:hypothetical protein
MQTKTLQALQKAVRTIQHGIHRSLPLPWTSKAYRCAIFATAVDYCPTTREAENRIGKKGKVRTYTQLFYTEGTQSEYFANEEHKLHEAQTFVKHYFAGSEDQQHLRQIEDQLTALSAQCMSILFPQRWCSYLSMSA